MLMYDARQGNYFNIFDLKAYKFTEFWNDVLVPIPTENGACVASDTEYIYVIGGKVPNKVEFRSELQIYSMSAGRWAPTAPSMKYERYTPACIGTVNSRLLYVK